MEKENQSISFEGDVYRDTVTYRFIELSVAALETAFEQDADLCKKYAGWLDDFLEKEDKKPIILYDIAVDADSMLQIFALPRENEFFMTFKAAEFDMSVSVAYDAQCMDVSAARVIMFSGNPEFALSWAEAMRTTLDDLLMQAMNVQEEE